MFSLSFPSHTTNTPVEKTNIPVPVVDVGGVRSLLNNPSWVPLTPLSHPWFFKLVSQVRKQENRRSFDQVRMRTRYF